MKHTIGISWEYHENTENNIGIWGYLGNTKHGTIWFGSMELGRSGTKDLEKLGPIEKCGDFTVIYRDITGMIFHQQIVIPEEAERSFKDKGIAFGKQTTHLWNPVAIHLSGELVTLSHWVSWLLGDLLCCELKLPVDVCPELKVSHFKPQNRMAHPLCIHFQFAKQHGTKGKQLQHNKFCIFAVFWRQDQKINKDESVHVMRLFDHLAISN